MCPLKLLGLIEKTKDNGPSFVREDVEAGAARKVKDSIKKSAFDSRYGLRSGLDNITADLFGQWSEVTVATIRPCSRTHDTDAIFTQSAAQWKQREPGRCKNCGIANRNF